MHTIHACPECVQARQQRAEIDRLREIVARLPTTKDGKAVTDNDLVFCVQDGRLLRCRVNGPAALLIGPSDTPLVDFAVTSCYSTAESAVAAAEKGVRDEG